MLNAHPSGEGEEFEFLGKRFTNPFWVSSMTGGTRMAGVINRNLARACREFGMGMGLGSCRIIMDDETYFGDFAMRPIIGDGLPFFANLGVAQVEEFLASGETPRIEELLDKLEADGLVVHVNPIQEFCQPEGDRFSRAPLETLQELLEVADYPVIVKEVGQGMGPQSLRILLKLPIAALEFGAYGGTNFSMVELKRAEPEALEQLRPLLFVGHDATEMVDIINGLVDSGEEIRCRHLIISGGIKSFLDGYYLLSRSKLPAVYGQASAFLEHARGEYEVLRKFIQSQVDGFQMARAYLTLKEE
jgi:isopentenyl-diphosphate delta-isomerase